jgi:hypothetical protein
VVVDRLAMGAVMALGLVGCSSVGGTDGDGVAAREVPTAGSPSVSESHTSSTCADLCYGEPEAVGRLESDVGISGMVESRRAPGVFYVVSDKAGTSHVSAVLADGSLVARIAVDGMSARNAEALAIGPCELVGARTCLYVGDIGNHVAHQDVFVYRMVEPDPTSPPRDPIPADKLRFTYPDAAPDAEALLVDDAGRPLIISKASLANGVTGPTHLFRGAADGGPLDRIGEIDIPAPENPVFAEIVGNGVTDASAEAGRVLLRTYDEVIEYRAPEADADLASFLGWPLRRVPAPDQMQSEAVAYRAAGCGYLTISEFTGSIGAVDCIEP